MAASYNASLLGNVSGYQSLLNSYAGFFNSSNFGDGTFFNLTVTNDTFLTSSNTQLYLGSSPSRTIIDAQPQNPETIIIIPDTGTVSSKFILSDYLGNLGAPQNINSDLIIAGDTELQDSLNLSALAPSSAIYLNGAKNVVPAILNDGELLIGTTGADPAVGAITSLGGTITVTNGPGTINLEALITLLGHITLTDATDQLRFLPGGSGNYIYVIATNPSANRKYNLPDVGIDSDFLMVEGTQFVNGLKKFAQNLQVGDTSFGGANTTDFLRKYVPLGGDYKIIVVDSLNSLIYTIPDTAFNGGSSSALFIMSEGVRTLNNISVFTDTMILNAVANLLRLQNNGSSTYYTLTATNPASSILVNMPDAATNTYFILGHGPGQIINIDNDGTFIFKGDNKNATPNQLTISETSGTSTRLLTLGLDSTAPNYGNINYFNGTSQATSKLILQKGGGGVSIGNIINNFSLDITGTLATTSNVYLGNSSRITSPASVTTGIVIIYGSGAADVATDVLKVRENTNTNPKEIWMGYNATNNYGVIQSVQNGVAYTPTKINPLGGNIFLGTSGSNLYLPESGTSGAFNYYGEISHSTVWTGPWGSNPTVSLTITRIGRTIHCFFPSIQATGNGTPGTISNSTAIPAGFRPGVNTNFLPSVLIGGSNSVGSMVVNTLGIITIFGGSNFVIPFNSISPIGLNATQISWTI